MNDSKSDPQSNPQATAGATAKPAARHPSEPPPLPTQVQAHSSAPPAPAATPRPAFESEGAGPKGTDPNGTDPGKRPWWRPMAPALAGIAPVAFGALVGLLLRGTFDDPPGGAFAPMLWIFILLAPAGIGVATVYLAEQLRPRSAAYHAFMPMLAVTLCLLGSIALLWEGWICVLLIWPLLTVEAAVAGLVAGSVFRHFRKVRHATVTSVVALPLVLGLLGVGQDEPQRYQQVERSVLVQAAPDAVWRELLDADRIRAAEVDRAWMYRIGVPVPLAGLTHEDAAGLTREVRMGKGIHFRQRSADWQPRRYVQWQYQFAPDSIPPGALDDHVQIGGRYFDLIGTRYTLTPRGDATELRIRMDYRVGTGFNWYAAPLARWLIGDFSETILQFYRRRAEAGPAA